jgi:hypothetical protein
MFLTENSVSKAVNKIVETLGSTIAREGVQVLQQQLFQQHQNPLVEQFIYLELYLLCKNDGKNSNFAEAQIYIAGTVSVCNDNSLK